MSATEDRDEALIARIETVAHGMFTGENAADFARLIALARLGVASGLPVMTGDDVEVAARAACKEEGEDPDDLFESGQFRWEWHTHVARAIISAMARAGWRKMEKGQQS